MPDTIIVKQSTLGAGGTEFKSIDWLGGIIQAIEGNVNDAAAAAGDVGTHAAKLRLMTSQLNTLIGHADGIEGFMDGIEGFIDGIEGSVDGIEGLLGGTLVANIAGRATGGATPFRLISTGTSGDATNVKASAGTLKMLMCTNLNAAVRYLKLYDSASAPTAGAGTPKFTFAIPGSTTGDGLLIPLPVEGVVFANGIGFTLVTGVADSNSTGVAANELVVNGAYF